eukprot:m.448988 g.448988  ORF g.448988 m.448988 type:complete len:348 (-) comp56895_c0_seq2:414-1457(-)
MTSFWLQQPRESKENTKNTLKLETSQSLTLLGSGLEEVDEVRFVVVHFTRREISRRDEEQLVVCCEPIRDKARIHFLSQELPDLSITDSSVRAAYVIKASVSLGPHEPDPAVVLGGSCCDLLGHFCEALGRDHQNDIEGVQALVIKVGRSWVGLCTSARNVPQFEVGNIGVIIPGGFHGAFRDVNARSTNIGVSQSTQCIDQGGLPSPRLAANSDVVVVVGINPQRSVGFTKELGSTFSWWGSWDSNRTSWLQVKMHSHGSKQRCCSEGNSHQKDWRGHDGCGVWEGSLRTGHNSIARGHSHGNDCFAGSLRTRNNCVACHSCRRNDNIAGSLHTTCKCVRHWSQTF